MNAITLRRQMLDRFQELTPHRAHRGYVGMSGIGGCLFDLYMRARHDIPSDDRLKWYGFTGQLHEAAVKRLLGLGVDAMGTFIGRPNPGHELVADFDDRYRGHYDAATSDGTLVEVKSVNRKKFQKIKVTGAPYANYAQAQAYMRHGGFEHAVLVYICRDLPHNQLFRPDPPLWTIDVPPDEECAEALDMHARYVLTVLDGDNDPPNCSCGWCVRNWA